MKQYLLKFLFIATNFFAKAEQAINHEYYSNKIILVDTIPNTIIKGHVIDAYGSNLANVIVKIADSTYTETDSLGNFKFNVTALLPNNFVLKFSHYNYAVLVRNYNKAMQNQHYEIKFTNPINTYEHDSLELLEIEPITFEFKNYRIALNDKSITMLKKIDSIYKSNKHKATIKFTLGANTNSMFDANLIPELKINTIANYLNFYCNINKCQLYFEKNENNDPNVVKCEFTFDNGCSTERKQYFKKPLPNSLILKFFELENKLTKIHKSKIGKLNAIKNINDKFIFLVRAGILQTKRKLKVAEKRQAKIKEYLIKKFRIKEDFIQYELTESLNHHDVEIIIFPLEKL